MSCYAECSFRGSIEYYYNFLIIFVLSVVVMVMNMFVCDDLTAYQSAEKMKFNVSKSSVMRLGVYVQKCAHGFLGWHF